MNLILVMLQTIGLAALAVSSVKTLENCGDLSVVARVALLSMVFFSLYAIFECLAAKTATRPGVTFLVFICGLYTMFRAWSPAGATALSRGPGWRWNKPLPF